MGLGGGATLGRWSGVSREMLLFVVLERVDVGKSLVTLIARIRLFPRVSPLVELKALEPHKPLPAHLATVGTNIQVKLLMLLQVLVALETLPTLVAQVAPFVRVRSFVIPKHAGVGERLAADWACERALPRVSASHMVLETAKIGESLAAHLADMRFRGSMDNHVCLKVSHLSKGPPTFLTHKRLFSCMSASMCLHVTQLLEVLMTDVAHKWLHFVMDCLLVS